MQYKFKTKPYKHQLDVFERSWNKDVFASFMEMGTGKSKILLDNIGILYDHGKINAALIVAPKGVCNTWYKEQIPTHLPGHIDHKVLLWNPSLSQKMKKDLTDICDPGSPKLHLMIMNVEALSTQKGMKFASHFLSVRKVLFAIDESTTIKNPKALRTKNIIKLGEHITYKRILTGSPVTKSPLDLYSQCYFLTPHLLGFFSYYAFRARYALMHSKVFHGRHVNLITGYQRLAELSEKLQPFSSRVLKEDCLDLPPKIYMKRYVTLSPEQKRMYAQMKHQALAELNGKLITAPTVLTQLMRLHQITCGHTSDAQGNVQSIPNNRLNELLAALEETEGKAIIWAHYQHDVEMIVSAIKKKFGDDSVVDYYGKTSMDDRHTYIQNFQHKDNVRFLVGTTQTGGYGSTLTAASTVIYYSNGYDLEKRLQSEDRAHRIGQKNAVTYIDLVAEDTIDERITKSLRKKINIATEIMGEELKDWI